MAKQKKKSLTIILKKEGKYWVIHDNIFGVCMQDVTIKSAIRDYADALDDVLMEYLKCTEQTCTKDAMDFKEKAKEFMKEGYV